MAKIKIQSVDVKCNAQVIMLDANFVSMAVRTKCAIDRLIEENLVETDKTEIDANGNSVVVKDHVLAMRGDMPLDAAFHLAMLDVYNKVAPFIDELVAAFEAE